MQGIRSTLLTLEHVDHVLEVNERVVDGNNLGRLVLDGISEDDSSDSTEAGGGERA